MSPQDTVTVVVDTIVEETHDHYTTEQTEERTYRFQIEDYQDLRQAVLRDGIDVLKHFLEASKKGNLVSDGWAIETDDGAVLPENGIRSVDIHVFPSSAYQLVVEANDKPLGVFDALRKLATKERAPAGVSEALMRYIWVVGGLSRSEIEDEWDVPENYGALM